MDIKKNDVFTVQIEDMSEDGAGIGKLDGYIWFIKDAVIGDGYDNVTICCTMENQDRVDYRLPIYKEIPIKHKIIICEPLLSQIDFRGELEGWVEQVVAGGESGKEARVCNYDWVLDIRRQCVEAHVGFWFKQTGSYLLKDGHEYKVARQFQHSQARKAELNYTPEK